jgi:hypothetical protein
MKGWRPSANPKARNRIGLFQAGVLMPDVGSIALSFPLGPRSPGFYLGMFRGRRVPFSRHEASRPMRSDGNGATPSTIVKMAPALHLLQRDRRNRKRGPKGSTIDRANTKPLPLRRYGRKRLKKWCWMST